MDWTKSQGQYMLSIKDVFDYKKMNLIIKMYIDWNLNDGRRYNTHKVCIRGHIDYIKN